MEVLILKNFKFAGAEYRVDQKAPSKRYPTVPFNEVEIGVLVGMGYIKVLETPKSTVKQITKSKEKDIK